MTTLQDIEREAREELRKELRKMDVEAAKERIKAGQARTRRAWTDFNGWAVLGFVVGLLCATLLDPLWRAYIHH